MEGLELSSHHPVKDFYALRKEFELFPSHSEDSVKDVKGVA